MARRGKDPPHRVLGHSDIAPARKRDPGEKFPWRLLYESGIGLWVPPAPITQGGHSFALGDNDPAIGEIQMLLARYGYGIPTSGYFDGETRDVIAAFQRHFRPTNIDGIADTSTVVTLKALLAARGAL